MLAKRVLAAVAVLALAVLAAAPVPALAKPKAKLKPNTGDAGSPCRSQPLKGPDPGPGVGLDTRSFGRAAPAAYEIGAPNSAPERDEPAHRVMMLIHGGAWS